MSGNGEFIPGHPGIIITLPVQPTSSSNGSAEGNGGYPPIYLSPGLGGGCVTEGPFRNMSVTLGPVALPGVPPAPGNGFQYNPRCLKRDLGPSTATRFSNSTSVASLLHQSDIWDFEMTMQGFPGSGEIGVHGGGHYTIAGDPGGDVFVSPGMSRISFIILRSR